MPPLPSGNILEALGGPEMNVDLVERVALVTGGGGGIGRACCRHLARAGAHIIINCKGSVNESEALKEEIRGYGFSAETFRADITDPEAVEALFSHVEQQLGRLDVLVNNAGIIRDRLLPTMKAAEWDRVQEVNLKGSFLTTQRALALMLPRHRGKIVNIASTSAIRGGRGQTNYAAAKGGLVSFTRACAVELAGKNIQVNAVLPGIIVTPMSDRIRKRARKQLLDRIPASRFGKSTEVAELVVFLASDSADYITGQAIAVDGGLSVF
jgi:3-oxoacyl-[acyl-carrier protein] reductase